MRQLSLQVDKWTLSTRSNPPPLLTVDIALCFSSGSNIKFTDLSSLFVPTPESAAERLLRPLPSPLWNKPPAFKAVAPSLFRLRLNAVVTLHSLARYTISYPAVSFLAQTARREMAFGESFAYFFLRTFWSLQFPRRSRIWWSLMAGFHHISQMTSLLTPDIIRSLPHCKQQ